MAVGAVNSTTNYGRNVAFQGNGEKNKHKLPKAIASAVVPGLGQMCDGRVGTGFKYLGTSVVLAALAKKILPATMVLTKTPLVRNLALAGSFIAGFGWGINRIAAVVNAYKKAS